MKILLYILFINLFCADWLVHKLHVLPKEVAWFPELVSLITICYILFRAANRKVFYIKFIYLFLLGLFLVSMLCGFVLNNVQSGVIFAGMRIYLRYIPFFLLPAVWKISDREFSNLLKFIFFLISLQLPVVIYQRFFKYSASISGDPMGGTLGASTSGVLSVLLLLGLALYIALYLKNQISFVVFLIGFAFFLLPTTMNETKITFILLPVCFIIPMFFEKPNNKKIKKIVMLLGILAVAFVTLKTIYDFFVVKRWGYGVSGFIKEGRIQGYIDMRLTPLLKTINIAFNDPLFFFFGVGAGNASDSFSSNMTGAYVNTLISLGMVLLGAIVLLWEIGFAGVFILLCILALVFRDAVKLSRENHLYGALGLGMVTIIPIYCVAAFYNNIIDAQVINILFWLLTGFVVQQAGLIERS